MHILPNVLSKGSQTMKFHQLTEYNMRKIFLKIIQKMWWRNYFYCMLSWGCRNILERSCEPPSFPSHKTFFENRKRSWTSLPVSFSEWFLKKKVYFVTSYQLIRFHCLVAFRSLDNGQYVYYNCLLTRLFINQFYPFHF